MTKSLSFSPFGLLAALRVFALVSRNASMALAFSTATTTSQDSSSSKQTFFPHVKHHENDPLLQELQAKHRPIAASFVPEKFNPHPLLSNCHLQTISGVFLRKNPDCAYITDGGIDGLANVMKGLSQINTADEADETKSNFWDERCRITTNCNKDFFTADIKYAGSKKTIYQSEDSKGLVVLIHGLESNSNSSLSTDMASAYVNEGYDAVCLNFRGCCGVPNDTLGGYHLGFTDDLIQFLTMLKQSREDGTFENKPIYLSGFSLGANVVVKCLGELGSKAYTEYNIHGGSVTGAPFDAERNVRCLDAPGFNRLIYSGNFLKTLKKRAQFQLDRHCNGDPLTSAFDFPRVMKATSIGEFDDAFIARVYGFESNIDYYRKNSCYYFLKGVAVPLFIINAGDDPFFDPYFFPIEEGVDGNGNSPIKMEQTQHGGHLGFMFHQLRDSDDCTERKASWMPMELARFINHVHECNSKQVNDHLEWIYL